MAASREEVYERVKEVLTEQLGVEDSEITEEASFQDDLDADSLDLVETDHGARRPVRHQDLRRGRQKIADRGQAVDYVSSHQ